MYWIKRCYLDGVGYKEAFYRDQTLNLMPEKWEIKSNNIPNSYLELGNGCGKTTLVSLILTVFEPQKNRFVQCVAGRKQNQNNRYNDYFHEELSTIIIEMVDDENRCLVLGQYHQKKSTDTEVIHFVNDSPDNVNFFEEIPTVGRAKASQNSTIMLTSISDARQWLIRKRKETNGYLRVRNTRIEWLEALKEVGINRQLIDSLIVINSEEGGVSHFANYKSEQDFLEKFYACCIPEQDINALAKTCSEQVAKGAELQKMIDKFKFYSELDDTWNLFQPYLLQAMEHKNKLYDTKFIMAEYLRDLIFFRKEKEDRSDQLKTQIEKLNHFIMEKEIERKKTDKEKRELEYRIADYELKKAENELEAANQKYEEEKNKLAILQSVGAYKTWEKYNQDVERFEKELSALQRDDVLPLENALKKARQKANRIYIDVIVRLNTNVEELKLEHSGIQNDIGQNERQKSNTYEEIAKLETDINTRKASIDEGEETLRKYQSEGMLHPNELPDQGQLRLQKEIQCTKDTIQVIEDRISQQEANQKRNSNDYEISSGKLHLAENKVTNCQEREEQVKNGYNDIQQQALELFPDFDANAFHFAQGKLEQLNQVRREYYEQQFNENRDLTKEIEELKRTGHLLVDKIVQEGLQLFYQQGLTKAQVVAFPNYLASILNDDAEKIAQVVDQNPGRYLGIAVSDEQTLEKVTDLLPNISWDNRPVPIYKVKEEELSTVSMPASVDAVLASKDKLAYSEKAWETKLAELQKQLDENLIRLEKAEKQKEQIETLYINWKTYWKQFGRHWDTILCDLDTARREREKANSQFEAVKKLQQETAKKIDELK